MHRAFTVALVLATGCRSVLGLEDPVRRSDAAIDQMDTLGVDAPDLCYGMAPQICLDAQPTAPVSLGGTLDTTASTECGAVLSEPNLCIVIGTAITVKSGGLIVTGPRPLVLLASDAITLDGVLDVSSTNPNANMGVGRVGAGANDATCPNVAGSPAGSATTGGGGGGGGSLGSRGGNGSAGEGGASGGTAQLPTGAVATLRGGCPGGKGGNGAGTGSGGVGGASGGAVALISKARIDVSVVGAIFASGAGGGPGNPSQGTQNNGAGGGGGSGGMIRLDAPLIDMQGIVAANGGGGGGGGDCCSGFAGEDGTTTSYTLQAAGGSNEGLQHGAAGGDGAGGTANAQAGALIGGGTGGGGGGGGGHGVVVVRGTLTGGRFSPAPLL